MIWILFPLVTERILQIVELWCINPRERWHHHPAAFQDQQLKHNGLREVGHEALFSCFGSRYSLHPATNGTSIDRNTSTNIAKTSVDVYHWRFLSNVTLQKRGSKLSLTPACVAFVVVFVFSLFPSRNLPRFEGNTHNAIRIIHGRRRQVTARRCSQHSTTNNGEERQPKERP